MKRALVLCAAVLALAGCGDSDPSAPEPTDASRTIEVTSPAFEDGKEIPETYTCSGDGTSPELRWTGVPDDASALALVVDDPDAPNGSFTHWVVVNVPARTQTVAAGQAPVGGTELQGSGGPGWSPPCPPSGTHHYRFTVYALRSPLQLREDASLTDAVDAIESATLAWGRLTGTVAGSDSGGGGY